MESLDLEIAEMEKKLLELKKKKALQPVTVKINKFHRPSGRLTIELSDKHWEVIAELRAIPGRFYSDETNNQIPAVGMAKLLERLEKSAQRIKEHNDKVGEIPGVNPLRPFVISWHPSTKDSYEKFMASPDFNLELSSKSTVKLELGPEMISSRLWLSSELQSITHDVVKNEYTFSAAEAWKFPGAIKAAYGSKELKIVYSEELLKLMEEQLAKQEEIQSIKTAMDWPDVPNPFVDGWDLKPLQRVAVKFSEMAGDKAIIAYPMGKGKTAISAAIKEIRGYKKVLIICPAPAKTNWQREIHKFTKKDCFILFGATPSDEMIDEVLAGNHEYYIINYDILARASIEDKEGNDVTFANKWSMLLMLSKFDLMIIDEAHRIKNTSSKRSRAVLELSNIPHILTLTGTPIVNRPGELFPLLYLADKASFSDEARFNSQFMYSDGSPKNSTQLRDLLSLYMIRRTPEQFGDDRIERIPYHKELSQRAKELYKEILNGVYISLRNPEYKRNVTAILAELTRCKQTCANDNVETTADLAEQAIEETGRKVLVFSQWKESQAAIRNLLGAGSVVINGDTDNDRRYEIIDEFQDPNSELKVIVTNITEILTLTEAHTVIFNDIWWTPKDHAQAEGRAFNRTNDPHGGNSYWVQNDGTIDDFLVELLQKKMRISEEIVDGKEPEGEDGESIAMALMDHLKSEME